MNDFLETIVKRKKEEVDQLLLNVNPNKNRINVVKASRKSFKAAMLQPGISVIAEIKRRSPSRSFLSMINDPVALADLYYQAGARAVSVLTDTHGFGGSLEDLRLVANHFKGKNIPILRKDFIIHEAQLEESIEYGADAILLIVAALGSKTESLLEAAKRYEIDAIVEVHTLNELKYALSICADLIAVNNRDLRTFHVDTNIAQAIKKHIPEHVISIAASGILSVKTAQEYARIGYNGLLIGEALVTAQNPAQFLEEIIYAN